MPKASFTPVNPVEIALAKAMQGGMTVAEFVTILLASNVYVPSSTEVQADGNGFRPLLFDTNEGTMMSVFTSPERTEASASHLPFCLMIKCSQLFARMPSDFGIVVNPGWEVGMEIPAQGIQDIRSEHSLDIS